MTTVTARREPAIIAPSAGRQPRKGRTNWTATTILIIGGLYCILPALWILVAATKTNAQLFSTAPYVPSFTGAFWSNMSGIVTYNHEIFLRWWLNSVIYAVGGGILSTVIRRDGRVRARQVPRSPAAGRSSASSPPPSCSRRCCWPCRSTCCWRSST